MKSSLIAAAAVFLGLVLPAAVRAEPPKVVSITPANGDQEVAVDVTEIRVVFDQPMGKGASWVGRGDFIDGQFKWVDDKTCVLPVKLAPGTDYRLSINSKRFTYFRSAAGEVVEPFPFSFRTVGGTPPRVLTPDENRKALEQLRSAIRSSYSYRDRVVKDWDAEFARASAAIEKTTSPMAFAEATGKMLGAAEDSHIWLKVGEQIVGSHQRQVARNYNLPLLTRLPGWKLHNDVVATARPNATVGYLQIRSWSFSDPSVLDPALDFVESLGAADSLIIDVRPNSGGSETMARLLAGCFVTQPVVYARNRSVSVDGAGDASGDPLRFTRVYDRFLQPNAKRKPFAGVHVYVLMGQANMSSCESFLHMMKEGPKATLVGATSYGSSGNPLPLELENGVTVFLPSWQDYDVNGNEVEGVGVEADVAVDTVPAELERRDPVLSRALGLAAAAK